MLNSPAGTKTITIPSISATSVELMPGVGEVDVGVDEENWHACVRISENDEHMASNPFDGLPMSCSLFSKQ